MKHKTKTLVFGFLLLFVVTAWGKTYYIPHIHTANDSWETYLIADSFYDCGSQGFFLTLYGVDGSVVLDHQYYEVDGNLVVSLRPLNGVAGEVECASKSMRFRLGYVAKESTGGGTAEFDLPSELSDKVVFSTSNYYEQLTWSGFAVFNGSDTSVTANVTILSGSGKAATQLTIPAKSKVVNYFDTQFGVAFSDITAVIFSCDSPVLTGITISGNENEKLLFTRTGEDRGGWKLKNKDLYSWVEGLTEAHSTVLAFCYSVDSSQAYMKGVNQLDGSLLYEKTDGYENLFPIGMVSDSSHSVAIAYGFDYSDSAHTYFFAARVNPDDGTLMWKTNLAESVDVDTAVDDRRRQQICVATNGSSTVQANMRNKDGFMTRAMINLDDGTVMAAAQTTQDLIPTALVFDRNTGVYCNIYSQYNTSVNRYSKVTFYKNSATSLTGGGSVMDLSDFLGDGSAHDVLVYGGVPVSGSMPLVYKASIGGIPPYTKWTSMDIHPSQYFIGTVPVNDFHPSNVSILPTFQTGMMGDSVNIVTYGLNDSYAFCGNTVTYDNTFRTTLLSFADGASRTLPINVRSVGDSGKFLISYEKERKVGTDMVLKRRKAGKDIFPDVDTWIEKVTLPDLLNEF